LLLWPLLLLFAEDSACLCCGLKDVYVLLI
jgi:hypothetical protein